MNRYLRATKRMELKPVALFEDDITNVANTSNAQDIDIEDTSIPNQKHLSLETGTSCNTDLKMSDVEELEQLKFKFEKLQNEVNYFNLTEKSFDGRGDMLTFYTGLESMDIFNLILDYIKLGLTSKNQRLTEFQKLLLCLMKLRLNLSFTVLGLMLPVRLLP